MKNTSLKLKLNKFSSRNSSLKLIPRLSVVAMVSSLILFTGCNMKSENTASLETATTNQEVSYITQSKESQTAMSPSEAVQMLMQGNKRFVEGNMIERDLIDQVVQTGSGQYPFAAVVSCIDSRIPTEMVFDQGVGDIFNARIAGNFVNTDILGSLEFATKVAGSKAIIVMGHTQCGAVKGAADQVKLGNLTATLKNLEPAVKAVTDISENRTSKNDVFVQKIADKNVEITIENIKKNSPIIREMFEKGELAIVGAMYDVETGEVTFVK